MSKKRNRRTAAASAVPEWRLPSRNARIGGGILAVITALFAIGTGVPALKQGLSTDDIAPLIVSALLAALAVGLGALSFAPAWTRTVIMRARGASD